MEFIKQLLILLAVIIALYFFMRAVFGHVPGFVQPLAPRPEREPRKEYITDGHNYWYAKVCPACGGNREMIDGQPRCMDCKVGIDSIRLDGRE